MRTRTAFLFAAFLLVAVTALAQVEGGGPKRLPIPGTQQPAAGLPWPQGLGRSETITGRIAAIDKDQLMVKSPDFNEILFWVDNKTVVRVEKFRLALSDLRVGDPVAVKLKKIKDKGPYAVEILPHPDVKERKLHPEQAAKAQTAEAPIPTDSAIIPPSEAGAGASKASGSGAGAAAAADARPAPATEPPFPSLPAGVQGVVGTVVSASGDSLELRDRQDKPQKVLLTAVTLIKIVGTQSALPAVKAGQRVAVSGDRMDTGEWVAREVLVSPSPEPAAGAASPGVPASGAASSGADAPAAQLAPARDPDISPDGLARFSGQIVSIGNGEMRVKTARGERTVLLTAITEVRRMGMRQDYNALRKGDQVNVVGDPLEGGVVSAREVAVTKN